jgi:hypothetical protein
MTVLTPLTLDQILQIINQRRSYDWLRTHNKHPTLTHQLIRPCLP